MDRRTVLVGIALLMQVAFSVWAVIVRRRRHRAMMKGYLDQIRKQRRIDEDEWRDRS